MTTPPIMPAAFIQQRTSNGATIVLAGPSGKDSLKIGDHVTVWSHNPGKAATAKVLGHVTQLESGKGAFAILKTEIDSRWPADLDIIETGSPVYLAVPDTFDPDTGTAGSSEESRTTVERPPETWADPIPDQYPGVD